VLDPAGNFHGLAGLGGGDVGSHQFSGGFGGFQVGYNWQIGRFLIGIEGQFSWSDMKGDHQNTTSSTFVTAEQQFDQLFQATNSDRLFSKVKNFGTIAARLGLVGGAEGRTLFYAKGGAGYVNTDYLLVQQFSAGRFSAFSAPNPNSPSTASLNGAGAFTDSETRWGPMAGLGLEFALFGGWTAKVEYDHVFLGTKSVGLTGAQNFTQVNRCFGFAAPGTPGACPTPGNEPIVSPGSAGGTRTFDVRQDISIIKFGLNYRFDFGNYYAAPVVTK
jgi:opacity protein-like surface antigen